jgi:release factor glutamine methyltransferase
MTTGAGNNAQGSPKVWTVLSLLEWADRYLRERSIQESRLNAELLLAHVLGLPRLGLYLQFDRPLDSHELAQFKEFLLRRVKHEPVQYILGEAMFMGIPLEVTPAVLIPRPETEELVEEVIRWLRQSRREGGDILDVGTGSGTIALALGKFLPGAHVTSLEFSADALELARRNCARHGLPNVEFLAGDIFAEDFGGRRFDALVSNPPYVSAAEFEALEPEIREFEPALATTDGADGLSFIRRIARLSSGILRAGGGMFLEIGYGQAAAAEAIAREQGLTGVEVSSDSAGIGRILSAFVPGGAPSP